MKKRQKHLPRWVIVIVGLVLILGGLLYYAISLVFPSQAVERAAMISGDGNTVSINGFDIRYRLYNAESENTPIIVVSGGGGLSSDYLEESLRFLEEEHPVLFYDARGCGRSQIKADLTNYSIQSFAKEIQDLKEYFFPSQKVMIVAHSFGGIVAMDYAADHSDDLEELILISSVDADYSPYSPTMITSYFKTGLPPRNQSEANEWYMQHIDVFLGPYFQNEAARKILDSTIASYAVIMHVGPSKLDLSTKLKDVNAPVLVLVGGEKEHPLTGINTAQHLEEIFPNARL